MYFIIIIAIMAAVVIVTYILQKKIEKEVNEMTIEKLKEKCKELAKEGNATKLQNFLKRHIVFICLHNEELKPFFTEMAEKYKKED